MYNKDVLIDAVKIIDKLIGLYQRAIDEKLDYERLRYYGIDKGICSYLDCLDLDVVYNEVQIILDLIHKKKRYKNPYIAYTPEFLQIQGKDFEFSHNVRIRLLLEMKCFFTEILFTINWAGGELYRPHNYKVV